MEGESRRQLRGEHRSAGKCPAACPQQRVRTALLMPAAPAPTPSTHAPLLMGTSPVYGFCQPRLVNGRLRTTASTPRPTARPTSSLPSGRSGGSAAGWSTLPLTCPDASAMTWMAPRGPSPLKVTCVFSPCSRNAPINSVPSRARPSAADAVGLVLCLSAASCTSRVPRTTRMLTCPLSEMLQRRQGAGHRVRPRTSAARAARRQGAGAGG